MQRTGRHRRTRQGGRRRKTIANAGNIKRPIFQALKGKELLRTNGERVEVTSLWKNTGGNDEKEEDDVAVLVFMRSFG